MKKITNILKWILLLAYFPVMLSFVAVSSKSTVCIDVNVVVKDSLQAGFVNSEEIRTTILEQYPNLLGFQVNQVNFNEMETLIKQHSAIKSAHIYSTAKGVIQVLINQHQPILRVFSDAGTYYLDFQGKNIPVSDKFTARVLVANGNIPSNNKELLKVARLISADPFWDAQMEQIYIRKNNEYILVPRVGDHLILLGKPENVQNKLENLKILYQKGLRPDEWNDYQVINLKYENQIICSKTRSL